MSAKDLDSRPMDTPIQRQELEDITTCCICRELYTDPKALPCIHTFCMKCLRKTGLNSNKGPGDEMPCPLCRRMFKIPAEGFPGLPKHFFIERLIQMSKVTDIKALCFLCREESKGQEGRVIPKADTYCIDCKYRLCEECCSEHKITRATKNHKLIPTSEHESGQNAITDLTPIVCEAHEQKFLDVYCANCKTVVCAICFIDYHKNHEGSHVDKYVDGFRKQIEDNTETLNVCIVQAQTKKEELLVIKEQMLELAGSLEHDIESRKEQIKQLVDKDAGSLLQSLQSERQSRLKEVQMETDDINAYLSNLDSYNSYCQQIMAKGSASDICSSLSDLSIRATELHQQCQPIIERGIRQFKFCLRQFELEECLEDDSGNLVGEIEKEGELRPTKRSKQILLAEQCEEINILRQENKQLKDERSKYSANIDDLKQELESNKTVITALQTSQDKEKSDLKACIVNLEEELESDRLVISALHTSKDEEEADYKARIRNLEKELTRNKTEIDALQSSKDKKEADYKVTIQNLEQTIGRNERVLNDFRVANEMGLKAEKWTNDSLQTKIKRLKKKLDDGTMVVVISIIVAVAAVLYSLFKRCPEAPNPVECSTGWGFWNK